MTKQFQTPTTRTAAPKSEMRPGPVTRWLARVGGGDRRVMEALNYTPAHTFALIALALFTTAGMAVISMWFALTAGVGVEGHYAWVLAGAWGLVIFNLDRLLTQQIRSDQKHAWVSILARLLLAGLIGTVVSTPLTLELFRDDIANQMSIFAQEQMAVIDDQVLISSQQTTVTQLEARLEQLRREAAGQGEATALSDTSLTAAETRVTELEKSRNDQQKLVDEASKLVTCELYGTGRESLKEPNRCSAKPGRKEPYPTYQRELDTYADGLSEIEGQLTTARLERDKLLGAISADSATAEQTKRTDAEEQIPQVISDLETARTSLEEYRAGLEDDARDARGLLSQLRALDVLSRGGGLVLIGHLVIAGLFILIEMIPVIAKVITRGKSTMKSYEKAESELSSSSLAVLSHELEKQRLARDADLDGIKSWRSDERHRIQAQSKSEQEVEDDMRARETKLGKQANQYVEDHMKLVLDAALSEWSANAQATLASVGQAQPNTSTPSLNGAGTQPNQAHNQSVPNRFNIPTGRP